MNEPNTLMLERARFPQWVCWKYGATRSNGKRAKVPINPVTGNAGDALDPGMWGSYSDAVVGEVMHGCDGIGFVLTEDDPYCALDLDDVIDPATGIIKESAQAIVNSIDSYWEVSPSYTGLRGILKGTKPGQRCTTQQDGIEVEVYDSRRFITITGLAIEDYEEINEQQQALTNLYYWLFGDGDANSTDVVRDGEGFSGTDAELLSKARNVGQWKMFRKLFNNGRWQQHFKSQSEADLKLATMLAFWCGPDEERVDRLFRRSKLYRDKWDEQRGERTYGELTIAKAIQNCPYFYRGKVAVTDEAQAHLHQLYGWLMSYAWNYRAGPTDRHVLRALLDHAAEHGTEHPQGVTVSMSARALMLEARVGSRHTVDNALERLAEKHGVVEVLQPGRGRRATLFLLKEASGNCTIDNTVYVYGAPCGHRIRNPSQYIPTIGKRNAQILDIVYTSHAPVTLDQLAGLLHLNRQRKSDLKHKNLPLLEGLGLIEYVDGGYMTPDDFQERMERELEESGANEAERLQRERVAREQEAFRRRKERKADEVPQMRAERPTMTQIFNPDTLDEGLSNADKDFIIHVQNLGGDCHCVLCDEEVQRRCSENHERMYSHIYEDEYIWPEEEVPFN